MIKIAVILAAGKGSRLGDMTSYRPKGFLELDNLPMIEHSIRKLRNSGIKKVIIVTGYLKESYEQWAKRYPFIKCVYNPYYDTSGSMQSLLTLKNEIDENFILLESDILYEQSALTHMIENRYKNAILASERTYSSDEVFIEVNDKGVLKHLSKNQEEIEEVFGEWVGITKLSYQTFQKMCLYAEQAKLVIPQMEYEQGFLGISKEVNLYVKKLPDLAWCEVDDENQWERAVHLIYPIITARENMPRHVKRNILLNPGPATTTETVKYAQIVPDICPREEEFGDVMQFISTQLTQLAGDAEKYTTVLFAGSGTAAVESIISSVIDNEAIVVIQNGAYGKRICQMTQIYHLPYLEYRSPIDKALDLEKLEAFIRNSPRKISHLAIVHHETTTGLLNPIERVGAICKKYGIIMIVDAMSSFAAIPIDMNKMNIGYLAASSNKNLQGMAGVSFVIANRDELNKTKKISPCNLYLNLYSQYEYFMKTKQMRFTPPVQTLYALKQAIIETKWEGVENRYTRYSENWKVLIQGITELGFTYLVDPEHHGKIITAIQEPSNENYHFSEMHDFFFQNGITIYPGKFENLNTFRIANMGAIGKKDIEKFIELLKQYMQQLS